MSVVRAKPEDAIGLICESTVAGLDLRRFGCIAGCGRCCRYKVSVLDEDIERIEAAGYARSEFLDAERRPANGFSGCLTLRDGACVFLDGEKRCTEYERRPVCCRLYPYIREAYVELQLDVDLSCPGVGQGGEVGRDELVAVLAGEGTEEGHARLLASHRTAIENAERLVAHRARLEPYGEAVAKIAAAASGGLGELKDFLAASAPKVPGRLLPREGEGGEARAELSTGGGETLRDYLLFWSRRQALWRWADAIVVVTPTLRSRLEAVSRFLYDLLEIMRRGPGAPESGRALARADVLDRMRACDSFYRTYCQGFRLGG